MGILLDKLILISKNNAFKNDDVFRGTLVIPASVGAGAIYTNSVSFTIPEGVDFQSAFGYFTNYSVRLFQGPPFTSYTDRWWDLNQIQDVFLVTSAGVINGQIIQTVSGSVVTITLRISRQGFSAVTITSSGSIPISLVAYSLAT